MIRKKISEYLDVYIETYREALSFISETRVNMKMLTQAQNKLIDYLKAIEQRPYFVTVTIRGKTTEDKSLQMGTVTWLKPGETKYTSFQLEVPIKNIFVSVTGAIITQCRIGIEEFITNGAVINSVICNTTATPANIIRIGVTLPLEDGAPKYN